jgi:hypothetical protein
MLSLAASSPHFLQPWMFHNFVLSMVPPTHPLESRRPPPEPPHLQLLFSTPSYYCVCNSLMSSPIKLPFNSMYIIGKRV